MGGLGLHVKRQIVTGNLGSVVPVAARRVISRDESFLQCSVMQATYAITFGIRYHSYL